MYVLVLLSEIFNKNMFLNTFFKVAFFFMIKHILNFPLIWLSCRLRKDPILFCSELDQELITNKKTYHYHQSHFYFLSPILHLAFVFIALLVIIVILHKSGSIWQLNIFYCVCICIIFKIICKRSILFGGFYFIVNRGH